MFYSDLLLGKRSALGKVWEYAHKSSALSRRDVASVDIAQSIKAIEDPLAPMALRAQGQLLYGVCRVYDGKTKVLMEDAQHAQTKLISTRAALNQSNNQSLHSKRAAADANASQIVASSAAISLGEREDDVSNQAINQAINAAFEDFSSHDYAIRLSMSQSLNQSLNPAINQSQDFTLEQARNSLAINQSINQFDEFEISGGGFSIDDDIDEAINQPIDQQIDQHIDQPNDDQVQQLEPDLYEDQPMDQNDNQPDHDQSVAQPNDLSIEIEHARDAEQEVSRRSVGAILGLDMTDVDIDMTDILNQTGNQAFNHANEVNDQANTQATEANQADNAADTQAPAPRPPKRQKVVKFRLEEDSAARLSDAELKRRLADPSDLSREPITQGGKQSTPRRRMAPNVLSDLMHSSVFSVGSDDPLHRFMEELFSVQGLRTAAQPDEVEPAAVDQSVDQAIDEQPHDIGRLSHMSDIVGGADIDLGFDEQYMDQSMHHDDQHVDQQIDQPVDEANNQYSEQSVDSQLELAPSPLFDRDEIADQDRIQREQSQLAHQFFSEPQVAEDEEVDEHANEQSHAVEGDFQKRQEKVLDLLNKQYANTESDEVTFDTLLERSLSDKHDVEKAKRKIASSLFYQLLVLSQRQALQCSQTDDRISIQKGRHFESLLANAGAQGAQAAH